MQDRESLECCKQSLMGDSGGSSEDDNVDRNEDTEGQARSELFLSLHCYYRT
jgi:hypothetical protein